MCEWKNEKKLYQILPQLILRLSPNTRSRLTRVDVYKQYQFDLSVEMELSEQDVWRFTSTASGELYVMTISTTTTQKLPATCSDLGILLYM